MGSRLMLLHSGASPLPDLAGYGEGWDQRGFDRVHVATLEAAAYTLYVPVGFRHASGADVDVAERIRDSATSLDPRNWNQGAAHAVVGGVHRGGG